MTLTKTLFVIVIGSGLVGAGYWWGATSHTTFLDKNIPNIASDKTSAKPGLHSAGAVKELSTASNQEREKQFQEPDREPANLADAVEVVSPPIHQADPDAADSRIVEPPKGTPIPVNKEAKKTLEEGKPAELHRKLEESGRDDSWSPYMEAQLRSYLSQKQDLSIFEFPVVECRLAGCEIQGVGYGENANQVWVNATADIYNQPWFEFKGMSTSVSQVGNSRDIVGMVIILLREPHD